MTITGVKAGTAVITVTDPATTGAAAKATYTVTVAPVRPTVAPTITFDKTSYNVGDLITMSVNAAMGDSASAQLFTSTGILLSSSVVASGTAVPTNGVHAIVGGVATYKFYAPTVSGTFTATATTGGAVDITTAATVSASVTIANASVDAAADAAAEATAAANDATDAAIQAADAAVEATAAAQSALDAVNELSDKVDALIKSFNSQIKAINTLLAKIAKKVKA